MFTQWHKHARKCRGHVGDSPPAIIGRRFADENTLPKYALTSKKNVFTYIGNMSLQNGRVLETVRCLPLMLDREPALSCSFSECMIVCEFRRVAFL